MRRLPLISLALCGATLLTTGCLPSPEERAARDYTEMLQPLLQENSLLADEVLSTAATLFNGARDTKDVEARWRDNIMPIADHLHHQAAILEAPEMWAADHKGLVTLWDSRAKAYQGLNEALVVGDREGWEKSREQSDKAKLEEEKWFQEANVRLSEWEISLDQFP